MGGSGTRQLLRINKTPSFTSSMLVTICFQMARIQSAGLLLALLSVVGAKMVRGRGGKLDSNNETCTTTLLQNKRVFGKKSPAQCYSCDGAKVGGGLCPGNAPWGEHQVTRRNIRNIFL